MREPAYLLADAHRRWFKQAYKQGLDAMVGPQDIRAIATALRTGDIVSVQKRFPPYNHDDPNSSAAWAAMADKFEAAYKRLFAASAVQQLRKLGARVRLVKATRLDFDMAFDINNPFAVAWIDKKTAKLLTDLSQQSRDNIQALIRQSFTTGMTIDQLTPLIKAQISLTTGEAAAVDRRYQAAMKQGVAADKAVDIAEQYTDKLMDSRAERIARTETIAAEAGGQDDAWREARANGYLSEDTQRVWIASEGACPLCQSIDGKTVGMDEPWIATSPSGRLVSVNLPPLHGNCRCSVGLADPSQPEDES